ncbi:hypothetical protein HETIRDRAFT_431127 [Heterobasidion irregulare TC 32-1]|uniref:Uncharacterized protein n=1 Tax=Heterobasidion irregulare (strain TC 32-1) TaxID=747525 RepID=W4JN09_HETIT|nr:uncharacterized protein HETIRDRAFT_431127 [Heterobasidion irregulare TC 32-1]ETW74947.1 hypothetical protein HETIRDRAFT_431127 [Heterobasidion irregulare TC 32-1]
MCVLKQRHTTFVQLATALGVVPASGPLTVPAFCHRIISMASPWTSQAERLCIPLIGLWASPLVPSFDGVPRYWTRWIQPNPISGVDAPGKETQNPSYRIVSLLRHPTTGDSGYKSRLRIVEKRQKHTDESMDYHELHMASSPFPGSKNRKTLYCRVFIHVTVSKDSDRWDRRQSTDHFPKKFSLESVKTVCVPESSLVEQEIGLLCLLSKSATICPAQDSP